MFLTFGFWHGRRDDGEGRSRSPSANGDGSGAGRLAFKLGLVSVGSIFVAALIAFVTIRMRAGSWREADMPGLPWTLWLSTLMLVLTSVAAEAAYRGVAKQRTSRLALTLGASVLFCAFQGLAWQSWIAAGLGPTSPSLYGFSFYMLTGLHVLHVFGGVALTIWAFRRSARRRLRLTLRGRSELVRFTAQYWHFLGVVWLVTWAALAIAL